MPLPLLATGSCRHVSGPVSKQWRERRISRNTGKTAKVIGLALLLPRTHTAAHGLSPVSKFILPSHWDHHHSCPYIKNPVSDYRVISYKNIINKLQQNIHCLNTVLFFLLGWSPGVWTLCADVSEHCVFHLHRPCEQERVPTFRNTIRSFCKRSCEQEESPCSHNLWRWNSVPKRWHIKFRRRGITQKKIPLSRHCESLKSRNCECYLRINLMCGWPCIVIQCG